MPENYEEFISLTLTTRNSNSKKPSRMLARNWKHQWLPLCLARQARTSQHGATRGKSNEIKSKPACIVGAAKSTRLRMWRISTELSWRPFCRKGWQFTATLQLGTQNFPMLQAMKIHAAKAAVDQEWEKLEKIPAWDLTKVRSKKEVVVEARTSGAKVHFASLMDICHLKNAELEAKHQKNKGRVVLRGDIVEDDSGSYVVFHRTRIISTTNDSSKSHGYHIQIARMRRTSSWCSICLYPGKNGRCSKITENSQIGMSRHLDSSTTTQIAQIMVQYGRPSLSLWNEICTVILWKDCYGKDNLRKSNWSTFGRRFPIGNACSYAVKKVILICVCGWHKIGKKQNIDPMWKVLSKEDDLGEATSFFDHRKLGMYSKTMWNKQRYCWQLQNHVWNTNFPGEKWKITMLGKSSYFFVVQRYGR